MFEKVNPCHPDKVADRIGGAIVDLAYDKETNPKIAVEVLIGHGVCHIIAETNCELDVLEIKQAVKRIAGDIAVDLVIVPQDEHLAENQSVEVRCGDNGIFKGMPVTNEQQTLTKIAQEIYNKYPYDGKYIINKDKITICQSNARTEDLQKDYLNAIVNPLGYWTGGTNVDTGATNRKLGSDMGDSATGGGINAKDLSKADVSVNIYVWLKAQEMQQEVNACCSIGDTQVDIYIGDKVNRVPYGEIVCVARNYIKEVGGFEKFSEWGLVR